MLILVPEFTIFSISEIMLSKSFPWLFAISSSGIFLSIFLIRFILPALLLAIDFITKSSNLSILLSLTYFAISSMKGVPYLIAFPFPTPEIFCKSSIDTGYCMVISSKEGS